MTGITAGLFLAAAAYIVGLSLWYVLTGQSNGRGEAERLSICSAHRIHDPECPRCWNLELFSTRSNET
jgi:hypothetical protein